MNQKEWTDEEILSKIFSKYKIINGEKWYDLDAMKAMTFDPRFPKSKLPKAIEFLKMIDEMQRNGSPLIKSNI